MTEKYDFIEIGTSDFNTLVQSASGDEKGLCIEPLQFYLDALPNRKNVIKDCCAISLHPGEMTVYYVNPSDIRTHKLPAWVRGCNSVGKPHPTVAQLLSERKLTHIQQKAMVPVKTYEQIMEQYGVSTVEHLKIDTEGHDCIVLKSVMAYCDAHPQAFPRRITFETNVLSSIADQQLAIRNLQDRGYKVVKSDTDTVMVRQC